MIFFLFTIDSFSVKSGALSIRNISDLSNRWLAVDLVLILFTVDLTFYFNMLFVCWVECSVLQRQLILHHCMYSYSGSGIGSIYVIFHLHMYIFLSWSKLDSKLSCSCLCCLIFIYWIPPNIVQFTFVFVTLICFLVGYGIDQLDQEEWNKSMHNDTLKM